MAIALTFMFFLAGIICAKSEYIDYNTTARISPDKINVHLVPHSHDDVGWLKTVDQYYVGANNSIRGACVQNVLDSVISALFEDKNRKFIYVEVAFFQRWWRQQSKTMKVKVKELVDSGQLEFINGGMCMHDEATAHYIDLIDQTTLGHQFIKDNFGQLPRVGWQIDPFGHSSVQAYLLGAELGFDSLFFARIDYQDRAKRLKEKNLEVIWRGSKSLGSSSQIFTGIFARHYDPPDGFTFEINDVSPPIQDDILLFDYNVEERVNDFVAAALAQANMDKFIHYVNKDGRVNALYSTPSIYTDAKYAANDKWPLKTEDFFPYADRPNAYWTGYFTSRPALKGYVRLMSGYYAAARQLEFFKGRNSSGPNTDALADALSIAQHHDAVSGTERQHVAADYALRISIGYIEAEKLVASSLAVLTDSRSSTGQEKAVTKFQQCPLLNISYCPPSEAVLSSGKSLVVVMYNPLGWRREEVVRIPVSNEKVIVKDSGGKIVESQLLPLSNGTSRIRNQYVKAYLGKLPSETVKYWLAFSATVPPLGFSTYIVSNAKPTDPSSVISSSAVYKSQGSTSNSIEVGQGNLRLLYSADEGKLTHYINSRNQVTASAEQSYSYYSGNDGTDKDPQASGAYVFRPNATFVIKSESQVQLTLVRGPLLDEVHQQLNPWISQITRVYKGKEHAEVEFTIGPIPIDDGIGKEITTQITTTMKTNKTFYTDSNGRDFIKRVRDFRTDWDLQVNQPIAGNYYPVNLGIYMQDDDTELSVLVDRSVGGSSLVDGQIELMLHRRLLHDDSRGVGEVLNETVCVQNACEGLTIQGKFYLRIDHLGEGAKWRRTVGQEIYSPLLLAFTEEDGDNWMSSHVATFSGIDPSYNLPNNIAIITLQELENGKVLLRLAHLYETGEDKEYSVLTSVELKKLFPNKKVK
ncbi:Alpha-mannosidase [Melia azedarach]|uniref:Alpha-mannosidase n=1 Tax=Melia azedarach TaxID=155640 RepID=A0ACC1Z2S4_MELAZ|nr:Alpha-mannosidase [Melia azedarach]